jgi:hypothetical protein
MSEKKPCLSSLLSKLSLVDKKIGDLNERLGSIKSLIHKQFEDEEEEVCPDVVESEKAIVEAIEKIYVEELMTREPEGDA